MSRHKTQEDQAEENDSLFRIDDEWSSMRGGRAQAQDQPFLFHEEPIMKDERDELEDQAFHFHIDGEIPAAREQLAPQGFHFSEGAPSPIS